MPRAKKSLGQNFLTADSVARRIADAVGAAPEDLVFEIGPGRGALTIPLARSGATIVAFEIDEELVRLLKERCRDLPTVEIYHADVRTVNFDAAADERGAASYKIAGNIPYHLTSTILIGLATLRLCAGAVLMVQREVGERILAPPGDRRCGILSIFLRSYYIIEKVLKVRPGSFTPPPKVESVVLAFTPDRSVDGPDEREDYLAVLKGAFRHRRKKLRSMLDEILGGPEGSLRSGTKGASYVEEIASRSGVDIDRRPEALGLDSWFRLYAAIRRVKEAR
jgi:16S rRNA (adenine1518-N6/adenine1519-N6)-dimethyltransferase